MSRRIALLAALPRELKPLVRGWKAQAGPKGVSVWTTTDSDSDELVAVCAGMGAFAARRAFGVAEQFGALSMVLSLGLAGATDARLGVGDVRAVSEIVDVQTGERFTLGKQAQRLRLATVPQTADATEKARLTASYGVQMVDMEAASVARLAAMRDLPLGCFKAISDAADGKLPEIDRFVDHEGQLQLPRFLAHLAFHPAHWPAVAGLAKSSKAASLALADRVREFLSHKDLAFTNDTGEFKRA